jgi:hypothetical protein
MLDGSDGMPIGVTEVRYGLRVDIIAMPAPAVWYTEQGLKRVGPTVFGYVSSLFCMKYVCIGTNAVFKSRSLPNVRSDIGKKGARPWPSIFDMYA